MCQMLDHRANLDFQNNSSKHSETYVIACYAALKSAATGLLDDSKEPIDSVSVRSCCVWEILSLSERFY